MRHLQALAEYFGVPAASFLEDEVTSRIDAQLDALAEEWSRHELNQGHDEVAVMAMRAGELSPQRRQQVMDLLDVVYRLEQAERGTDRG